MKPLKLSTMVLLAIAAPAAALKGKPSPPPSSANPELAYIDAKPRFPELKLANEDLTGAFTIFRSAVAYQMPRYDLSPRGQNQVAVTSGGVARLLTWSLSGTAVSVSNQPLVTSATGASSVSFSSDGTRIAVAYHGDSKVRIFDVATRQEIAAWPVSGVQWMAYYPSGNALILWRDASTEAPGLAELSPTTGALTSYAFPANDQTRIDTARSSDAVLMSYLKDGINIISRWQAGTIVQERIADGIDPHYKCDESRIVFRANGSRPPTRIYNVGSNSTNTLTNDPDVQRVDYMPSC